MSETTAENLFHHWRELLGEGQFVPAEEICEGCPDLVPEVESLIQQFMLEAVSAPGWGTVVPSAARADATLATPLSTDRGGPAQTRIWGEEDTPTDDELIFTVNTFGDFKLLAKGGLGEVFLAGDKEFHRDVVLKFMRKAVEKDPASHSQFALEAEVAARLDHPGIVPVYGMGHTSDGRPFQVMRFIRGTSLDEKIEEFHAHDGRDHGERNLEFRQQLLRFASVCQTIAYAHSRGIVHRDIKPDNIMLGKYGETLVVDWGLAMPVERDEEHRRSGEHTINPISGEESGSGVKGIAGTPCYMSPEQAEEDASVGPPSDVYSLGALLYKVLTGVPPYQGTGVSNILNKVKSGTFPPPRSVNASVPPALEAICLKAMQREPEDRYSSPLAIAADIEAYLADEPVSVYREPATARLTRWIRHHHTLAQSLAALLLITLVGLAVWGTQSVVHARHEVHREAEFLATQAELQASLFLTGIDDLRDDVLLLAKRPQVRAIGLAAAAGAVPPDDRESVKAAFRDFLGLNPDYVQVRFLDANGLEIVRVDRRTRGGSLVVVPEEELQNKFGRPYFRETARLEPGQVHLSPIDVNVEHGVHQWDVPVIRAAAPLDDEEGHFMGIVIINLHFQNLADMLVRESEHLSTMLVDDEGRFLYHSEADPLEFCFERRLDVPVEAVYPQLANFRQVDRDEDQWLDVVPSSVVLAVDEETPAGESSLYEVAGRIVSEPEFESVVLRRTQYSPADIEAGTARAMVVFVDVPDQVRDDLVHRLRAAVIEIPTIRTHVLPVSHARDRLAVHARKIRFDPEDSGRYLQLVLTHGY